jgi:hypothetical protein
MSIYNGEAGPVGPETRPCNRALFRYAVDEITAIEKTIAEHGPDESLELCQKFIERIISPYDRTQLGDETVSLVTLTPKESTRDYEVDSYIQGFLTNIPGSDEQIGMPGIDTQYHSYEFTYRYHQDGSTRDVNKVSRVESDGRVYYGMSFATLSPRKQTAARV